MRMAPSLREDPFFNKWLRTETGAHMVRHREFAIGKASDDWCQKCLIKGIWAVDDAEHKFYQCTDAQSLRATLSFEVNVMFQQELECRRYCGVFHTQPQWEQVHIQAAQVRNPAIFAHPDIAAIHNQRSGGRVHCWTDGSVIQRAGAASSLAGAGVWWHPEARCNLALLLPGFIQTSSRQKSMQPFVLYSKYWYSLI